MIFLITVFFSYQVQQITKQFLERLKQTISNSKFTPSLRSIVIDIANWQDLLAQNLKRYHPPVTNKYVTSCIYYNFITMPFKEKLIKDIQKCIHQFSQNTSAHSITPNDSGQETNKKEYSNSKSLVDKRAKVFTPKIKNIYLLFLKQLPPNSIHVVNFYNMIAINEESVHSEDFEQSYCRTAFYLKSIKKAQFRPNCLIFHLTNSNHSFAPIEYSIERFKSLGSYKFYHLACIMQEIIARFKGLKDHVGKQIKQENNDKFDKYLHSLGNRMFVVRTSSKFILSKSFLQLLEHNPEDYSIEAVKFRSSLYEGCSTKNYYQVMVKTLQNIKNLVDLLFDKISLETFLDNSILRCKDVLYTKNNKKIYAKIKTGMPNPYVTIYEVEQVINVSDQLGIKSYFQGEKQRHLNTLKQQFQNAGIKTVRNLMNLPPSYLPENQHRVSHYVQKGTQDRQQTLYKTQQ